jgi:signal transduction histidine kinase
MTEAEGLSQRRQAVPPVGSWLDVGTVALVTGLSIATNLWHESGPTTAWWIQLVVALPLVARRRFPAEVFVATAAVALTQYLYSGNQAGEIALLAALYSVGAHERRRWALLGIGAVALVGGSAAVVAWSPDNATLQTVVLLDGTVIAALVTGVYRRTRQAYLQSVLDRAATAERERDQQALTIRAVERDQLSREIHDIVAHNLSVMIALGDGAAVVLDRNPAAARTAIEQSSATGRQALDEIRRVLGVLRDHGDPQLGPQPGLADLDELVARVRTAELPVELVISGRPHEISAGAELAVYRIVQEGLTNVLKHAPLASAARVELRFAEPEVSITISNDGTPLSAGPRSQPGHGLTGMRERAAVFAGEVEAGPVDHQGWRVRARLVLPAVRAATW